MKKEKKQKCATRGCKREAKHPPHCNTCHSKHMRERNPVRTAYNCLKGNSKRRGHAFNLTLAEFEQFCTATDYMTGKGRTKDHYSIDRIDPTKGYSLDNIQRMTVSENSKKGKKLVYDWVTGTATVIPRASIDQTQNIF